MSAPRDSYLGIARHYDAHGWDWYARVYGSRLADLLRKRGLEGSRVLDAGCGTGTLAIQLAAAGFVVTGVDLSEAMLDVARGKDAERSVRWTAADLTTLDLGRAFDAVVAVADVLNHLETLADWEAVLRRLRAHLRPGGILFFDVMTVHGLSQLDPLTIQEKEDRTLIAMVAWEPRSRRSTLKITSYLPVPGSSGWDRASETIPEWGHPVREILATVARAGFDGAERPFAEAGDPERDERLAVLARAGG
jgi:SAM-dependent methyltransferase